MISTRNRRAAAALGTLLALALLASPALGAPLSQTNLLQNPGFEAGSLANWEAWAIVNDGGSTADRCLNWARPTFQINSAEARSGAYAAQVYTAFASHNAGLYQVVSATPGATYRFSMWAKAVSADENYQNSDFTAVQIGIDPSGGRDASSGAIVWSGVSYPMSGYAQLAVEATASANQITVFTRSQPNWCLPHNDVFYDDASLAQTGGGTGTGAGATAPAQQPTQPPTSGGYRVATPDASGRIVHTVQEGDMLGGIAALYGVTVQQIVDLNNLSSSNFIVLGQQLVIKEGSGAAPAATEPPATGAAASTPEPATEEAAPTEPAPTQEPVEVAEQPPAAGEAAGTGTLCVLGFEDTNGNAARDPQEPSLAGITFALNRGEEMIERYTTDGVSEPYCFAELPPGTYRVSWTGDRFAPTTDQAWEVQVQSGAILSHEFGAQPDAGAVEAAAPTNGLPNWLVALLGSLAVVVFLSAVGLAIFFFYLRPRTG